MEHEQAVKTQLLVLGLGSAANTIIHKLRNGLDPSKWDITVVHRNDLHTHQPGLAPFGTDTPTRINQSRHSASPDVVDCVIQDFDRVDPAAKTMEMTDRRVLAYKYIYIVIA